MRAIIQNKYGTPAELHLTEIPVPVPAEDEVLVRVHASSVNFGNLALLEGKPYISRLMTGGLLKPAHSIPGGDLSGVVADIGRNVTHIRQGDEVYADNSDSGFGAFAEYICVKERLLARKPANINFEQAAAVPQAGMVALQAEQVPLLFRLQSVLARKLPAPAAPGRSKRCRSSARIT